MAKSKRINLLPQEEFEASIMGRVLRWAMGTFRIIVIITEMIVMGAFLSRFWLDAQNSDLSDKIKVQNAEITAQADFEKEFRGVQTKLKIFNNIHQASTSFKTLKTIASKIPTDVVLTSLTINSTATDIKGASGSESGIAQLISNLKAEPTFKTVDLGSLGSSETDSGITNFSIRISY
ncbi:MAG TPA: PilN domain-containing protein [Patescibacteria group bacterium]|nr:PilN domain-containing protein [Patescibacteria group bacterium]